jgi:hypothetical protein
MVTLAPPRRPVGILAVSRPAPAATDDRQVCYICDRLAVWTFKYHNGNDGDCDKRHLCQDHTDEVIVRLNRMFRGFDALVGPCPHCDNVFYSINDYVRVERIP